MSGRQVTWSAWMIEQLVVPLIPVAFAVVFSLLSGPTHVSDVLWGNELPLMCLAALLTSYRELSMMLGAKHATALHHWLRVGVVALGSFVFLLLVLFYGHEKGNAHGQTGAFFGVVIKANEKEWICYVWLVLAVVTYVQLAWLRLFKRS